MTEIPWQIVRLVGPIALLGPPVAFYVYRQRTREGDPHPVAWAVGVGLLGVVGLLWNRYWHGDFTPE